MERLISIDQATRCCGIAIFDDGVYIKSFIKKFPNGWDIIKFKEIMKYFDLLFEEYEPSVIVLEEPVMVRNSRAVSALQQLAGGIMATALNHTHRIDMVHNRTVKKVMHFKDKSESLILAENLTGKACATDDESDAILIGMSYIKLVDELGTD